MRYGALVFLALAACDASTGGAVITLPMQVQGMVQPAFSAPGGWQVQLSIAKIALGPFYFNVAPPPTNALRGGTFILEATQQVLLDALSSEPVKLTVDGITGHAVAAEVDLLPLDSTASDADASLLGNNVGLVAGTATRAGTTLAFRGPIIIDASLATPEAPLEALARVNGAVLDLTVTARRQTLWLTVDAAHWFDSTDFASLVPSVGTQPSTWTVRSTFAQQLLDGVRQQSGVYAFALSDP